MLFLAHVGIISVVIFDYNPREWWIPVYTVIIVVLLLLICHIIIIAAW